jgi:AraC-like DNA-binding protein
VAPQTMNTALDPNSLFVAEWIRSCTELMNRCERFAAADLVSTRQRVIEFTNGRSSFAVTDSGRFLGYDEAHAAFGRVSVRFLSWDSEAKCETSTFRTPDHHVSIHIPLVGEFEATQGHDWLRVSPGQALIVCAAGKITRRWQGRCDHLNVRIDRDILNSVAPEQGLLDSHPLTTIDLNKCLDLGRFIETIIHDLGSGQSTLRDPDASVHAEKLLALFLLKSLQKKVGPALAPPQIAPFYVRRVEKFIAENFGAPIAIAELAAVSGVSARTLYYGFKQYRGASPMKYLKTIRLLRARRALLEAQINGGRVGDIAAAAGYDNKSQFARDYKDFFGATPTQTLTGTQQAGSN